MILIIHAVLLQGSVREIKIETSQTYHCCGVDLFSSSFVKYSAPLLTFSVLFECTVCCFNLYSYIFLCPVLFYTFLASLPKQHNSAKPPLNQAEIRDQDGCQEPMVFLGLCHLHNPHSLNEYLVILLNVLVCCHLFVLLLCLNVDFEVSLRITSGYVRADIFFFCFCLSSKGP